MSKICIGAGHGGSDPGACNGTRHEADDNLRFSLAVAKLLRGQGHEVILTRVTDTNGAPEQRRKIAIDNKSDIYIDIHRNSHTDPTAKGVEIWIRNMSHAQAAGEVLERLAEIENQGNRGVKIGSFIVLYDMPMPAMLLELGFISNARDNALYDKYFDENATAVARGILAALGKPYAEPGNKPAKPLAKIQFGAFTWPDNEAGARKILADAKAAGFEAFLVIPATPKEDETA